ncbi:hypothetical protein [Massilia orientalis]|uniref:Uncharacterized protein n=1 Tax=Massilia orientalis TaxID=3050128 RepID=A0ACC7MG20_9BURK|nr:hypothetical protein [Massilia sp. YIM B02787]
MQDLNNTIQATFDPSFIRMAMQMWREATDLKVPVHDEFKVHFMENRGQILTNFANTATAWSMMLRALTPTSPADADACEALRGEIEEFQAWAKSEIAKLEHLAVEEALSACLDDALLSPGLQNLFKPTRPKPPAGEA